METPPQIEQMIRATREAADGVATCIIRPCGRRGPFKEFITVMYGGGLAAAVCMPCAETGARIMIQRGPGGIEVRVQGQRPVAGIAVPDVDILTRRPP